MATKIIGSQVKTGAELNVNAATATVASSCTGNAATATVASSCTGNAATATSLATARTIAISGGATGTATSFDGSANIEIPVTSLDASKLTGTASVDTTGGAAKDGDGNEISSTYLKLSGGAMTGSDPYIKKADSTGKLTLTSGTTIDDGSYLCLYGEDASNTGFSLAASADSTKVKLVGKTNGALTWDSQAVLTSNTSDSIVTLGRKDATGKLLLTGGTGISTGSRLLLVGVDNTTAQAGNFYLGAYKRNSDDSTSAVVLMGTANGGLTWGGKNVERVSAISSNYIRWVNGMQICWGSTVISATSAVVTYVMAFSVAPIVMICYGDSSSYSDNIAVDVNNRNTTSFGIISSTAGAKRVDYIAVGRWC